MPTAVVKFIDSNIPTIQRDAFALFKHAFKMMLYGNRIVTLEEESFKDLPNLTILDLSENNIESIPSHAFMQLPKLKVLKWMPFIQTQRTRRDWGTYDLRKNKLQTIHHDAFNSVPVLGRIHLENNNLSSVNFTMFRDIPEMSFVALSNNQLARIDDDIQHVCHVEHLFLDHNQLTFISPYTKCMKGIQALKLDHNKLTTLESDLSDLFQPTNIYIDNNPWSCDCTIDWLIKLTLEYGLADQVFCTIPFNTTMQFFNTSDIPCSTTAPKLLQVFKEQEGYRLRIILFSTLGVVMSLCILTSLVCLWKRRQKSSQSSDALGRLRIAPISSSPCAMVQNENYRRLSRGYSTDAESNSVLTVGKLIGSGAFGEVYEGYSADVDGGKTKVAIKMIKENSSAQEFSALQQEFKQLTQVDKHPYIIQVFSTGKIDGSFVMVMEMAKYGDLLSYLRKVYENEELIINSLDSAEEKFYLIRQQPRLFAVMWNVAKGMEYLSHLKILHRDLAARNILLCDGMVAKIADFGLSRDVYESGYYYQDVQGRLPYKWLSPETLLNGKSTLKSDVWSLGILMWEMVTLGSNPYPGIPPAILIDMYKNRYVMPKPPLCPDEIYTIMKSCWDHCVETRPNFTTIAEMLDAFVQSEPNKHYLSLEEEPDETSVFIEPVNDAV